MGKCIFTTIVDNTNKIQSVNFAAVDVVVIACFMCRFFLHIIIDWIIVFLWRVRLLNFHIDSTRKIVLMNVGYKTNIGKNSINGIKNNDRSSPTTEKKRQTHTSTSTLVFPYIRYILKRKRWIKKTQWAPSSMDACASMDAKNKNTNFHSIYIKTKFFGQNLLNVPI